MRAEVVSKLSPLEKFVVRVIQKKFEALAQNCKHRFLNSEGLPDCAYHTSAIGLCQPVFCPRLRSEQSGRNNVNEVERKEDKSIERIKRW